MVPEEAAIHHAACIGLLACAPITAFALLTGAKSPYGRYAGMLLTAASHIMPCPAAMRYSHSCEWIPIPVRRDESGADGAWTDRLVLS